MLKLLSTLARVAFGYALASIAAGLVTVLFVNTPADVMSVPLSRLPETASETFGLALLTATHAALFAVAFVLIVAGLAEWFSIRAMSFYVVAGIAIAALGFGAQYSSEVAGQPTIFNSYAMMAFLTTGLFAGFVYWLAAGQFAGVPPPATASAPSPAEAEASEPTSTASAAERGVADAFEPARERPRFVDAAQTSYHSLVGKLRTLAPRKREPVPHDDIVPATAEDDGSSVVEHPSRSKWRRRVSRDDEEPSI